ncbi:SMC-Scp complex subunit ScpB [Parapedomonas caeni]
MTLDPQHLRMAEAILFAATAPLKDSEIADRLPDGADVPAILAALADQYAGRGVELVKRGPVWLFQTAPDLAFLMRKEVDELKKLSRAAVETLAIVAYHQPVSRADIEDIRGVSLSKGTLDLLLEAGWVKPVGRREAPGRPVIYGTTVEFLAHFGLESIKDLPGLEELKGAGLLEPQEVSLGEAMGVERTVPEDVELELPLPPEDEEG